MVDIEEIYCTGELFDSQYKLLKKLSTSGGSADVWLAIDINTVDEDTDEAHATQVAIKIYRPKNIIDGDGELRFRGEFKKVFNCHHENIIKPTYFSVFREAPYLVMPYCPAGSTERLVGKLHRQEDLWKYIYEVASGLAYLHEHTPQIIHQDIKPANVLIDDNGNYAITDFGISAAMADAEYVSDEDSAGTMAYMAPERFEPGATPMPESDIWAFGATLYEIIEGDTPYGDEGGAKQKKHTPIPAIRAKVPEPVKQLVYSCLAYDPKSRPTARHIVDTVLKKRFSRTRLFVGLSAFFVVAAAALCFLLFKDGNTPDPAAVFEQMCSRGDSVLYRELDIISHSDGSSLSDNLAGLEKAAYIYRDACREAPASVASREMALERISLIESLETEITKYDSLGTLADRARRTEMNDLYLENSVKQEYSREIINNIINQIINQ